MTIIIVVEFLSKVSTRMDFFRSMWCCTTSANFEQAMGQQEKSKWQAGAELCQAQMEDNLKNEDNLKDKGILKNEH